MDIIAAHRAGLTEKLDVECVDLAGRARDFGQRAIVLHHLYDHSLGGHWWALVEAHRQLATDRALQRLDRLTRRWWRSRASRDAAVSALMALREALGREGVRRTAAAYRAYRMAGTPALVDGLEEAMAPGHAVRLVAMHVHRRERRAIGAEEAEALSLAIEKDVGVDPAGTVAAALDEIGRTYLGRPARRLLIPVRFDKLLARHRKRGWSKLERALREDPFLPAEFRANPAQHFFALQHGLADRRRKGWVEGVGEGEALAA